MERNMAEIPQPKLVMKESICACCGSVLLSSLDKSCKCIGIQGVKQDPKLF